MIAHANRSGSTRIGLGLFSSTQKSADNPDVFSVNCGSHGHVDTTCKLAAGRVVRSINPIAGYNDWWQYKGYDPSTHSVTVHGNGQLLVEYEPVVVDAGNPDYDAASSSLQSFISKLLSCSVSPDTPVPSVWNLPAPKKDSAGKIPASVKAAWDSYKLRLDVEVSDARDDARLICAAPASTGTTTTTETDTTGSDAPDGSNTTPVEGDAYTPGYYPTGGTDIWNQTGGATVIPDPFAPPPPPPKEPTYSRGKMLGVGGAVAGLGLVWLLMRKRRRRKQRVAFSSTERSLS